MASPAPESAKKAPEAPATITPAQLTEVHVTSTPDVCLIVSSDTKIFANVAVLRNASEAFKLMFDARFPEGQAIIKHPGQVQDVDLPEDDPQAMTILARLLHGGCDITQFGMPKPNNVHGMCVLADKYLVCDVVKPVLATFLNSLGTLPVTDL